MSGYLATHLSESPVEEPQRRVTEDPLMEHDHAYKLLFAHPELAAETLRDPRYAPVRRAVNTWLRRFYLPRRFPGLEFPQGLTL